MGSRTFILMAIVFVALGAAHWWFTMGPGRPDAVARSFTVQDAWPSMVRSVRPTLRDAAFSLERAGVPRALAPVLVVVGVLALGFVTAWLVLRIVTGLFTGVSAIAGIFQVVIVPLWQIGLTLVSAAQTVEWLRDRGFLGGMDATTPAFVGYAIVSLVMLYGLSKVRSARA
jgi:hypothetical protein